MISVIIPLYNKEKCIRKTIDSILNQKGFSDFEIVVVDDGSTDESCRIVETISDNRVVLYHKKMVEYLLLEIMVLFWPKVIGLHS